MSWPAPAHTPYQWQDAPSTVTPLDSTHLIAAEDDLVTYTQQVGELLGVAATTVKTAAYAATAGDFVPVDASGGSVAIALPTQPPDATRVGVKLINVSGTNTCTIDAGGSDVFNKTGGSSSLSLAGVNQSVLLQYQVSTGIWHVQASDLALNPVSVVLASFGAIEIDPSLPPYNAAFNVQYNTDCTISGGSLSQASSPNSGAQWQASSPVGDAVMIPGVGAGGTDLFTTITAFDGVHTVTLNTAASSAVSSAFIAWGTDDTAAHTAAFAAQAANPSLTIRPPAGRHTFCTATLASTWPRIRCEALGSTIYFIPNTSLITNPLVGGVPQVLSSLHVENLYTVGGQHPLIRLTYTGAQSNSNSWIVQNCHCDSFTGSAISSLSSDHPYWKIRAFFRNPNVDQGFGVALAGFTDACDISVDTIGVLVGVKLGLGGNSCRVHDCSFIPQAYAGTPRVCIWHVTATSSTNDGEGCDVRAIRFNSENYNSGDFRGLVADENTGSGADFASHPPSYSASTNFVSGLHYSDCVVHGSGTYPDGPVLYSTTPNLSDTELADFLINGTSPSYAIEFLNPPPAGYSTSTNGVRNWRATTAALNNPGPAVSNDPAVYCVDPYQLFN